MTAHPIDTEALGRRAGHVLFTQGPEQPAATARETCVLLDLLATTEHRATRAEAERDWNLRSSRGAKKERIKANARADQAEARIKAARELHQQSALIRHVPRSMRQGHDDDQPFHYCTGCDGARYPCATIRALDGDA